MSAKNEYGKYLAWLEEQNVTDDAKHQLGFAQRRDDVGFGAAVQGADVHGGVPENGIGGKGQVIHWQSNSRNLSR